MPAPTVSSELDLVNEFDQPVGTVRRGEALRPGVGFRVVHVFVFNANGDLLIQRLAGTRDRHPGQWGSSVAGYLHAGESYEAGARRRLKEELAVAADPSWRGKWRMQDEGATKFIGLFSTVADDARIAEPSHIAALDYVDPEDLGRRLVDNPRQFTETFRYLWSVFPWEQQRTR